MQLGSLRQLTLVSFALVLVPLVVLLWHSQITLGRMGEIATNEAEFSVAMVRRVNSLESFSVDIERLIRQYHVLDLSLIHI